MDFAKVYATFDILAQRTEKDPSCFVFIGESDGKFVGNVKHLFLYFARQRPDVESWFFTIHRDTFRSLIERKLPALLFPDMEAVQTLARAGTVIVDTFDYKFGQYMPLCGYAKVVQLWHGVGFKKIGFVEKASKVSENVGIDLGYAYSGYDTVVTTSPFYVEEVFKKSFEAKQFLDLGYPRNDALFARPSRDSMLNCDQETFRKVSILRKKRKTILYAPTFRDQKGSPVDHLDFKKLHRFLDREGLQMVIKTHRLTAIKASSNMPYISFYQNHMDAYPFMFMVDVMATDYSSIFMDYLLLDRPVAFFCPDYDEYVTYNREFQFPYDEMTPGPKCRTQDEFHAALKLAAYGDDGYGDFRQRLAKLAFRYRDGNASKRIADHLCGPGPE